MFLSDHEMVSDMKDSAGNTVVPPYHHYFIDLKIMTAPTIFQGHRHLRNLTAEEEELLNSSW